MIPLTEEILHLGTLSTVSKLLGEVVGYIGIMVMMYGAAKGLYMFIVQTFKKEKEISAFRIELGQYLTLGLEFLIGKDIIESLVHPTWDDLGKLGAIIILRSILTLFLERELKQVAEEELHRASIVRKRR